MVVGKDLIVVDFPKGFIPCSRCDVMCFLLLSSFRHQHFLFLSFFFAIIIFACCSFLSLDKFIYYFEMLKVDYLYIYILVLMKKLRKKENKSFFNATYMYAELQMSQHAVRFLYFCLLQYKML